MKNRHDKKEQSCRVVEVIKVFTQPCCMVDVDEGAKQAEWQRKWTIRISCN